MRNFDKNGNGNLYKYSNFSPGGGFKLKPKAAGPSDPRREAELDPKQDCLTEPLLDWMAEAINEGAMELIREVTLWGWILCFKFSLNLIRFSLTRETYAKAEQL